MTVDLSGKVAFVTGGARGIGLAIAQQLYDAGAAVGLSDLKGAPEAAATLTGRAGSFGAPADVSDAKQLEAAVAAVETSLGPIDILVNNAGITRDTLLMRMSEEDWDLVLRVNLKGTFNATKIVSRGMMKRRWGRIINIASVVGIRGNAGQANYSASKAGVIGFTKTMARELAARNVLVNAIAPGFIDTDMTKALSDGVRQELLRQIPLARLGNPGDVAKAALFLASGLADYITGQVVVVDGGMVM
ncbi:MAG: 3-oxoacyl-[acyl-carrier-protein] reductase [Gemmatimonadales bacterium]|nr:3-oxoacyl-[acyl-carrier-protein] reductase [Gemmatimonadales bacterium]